MGQVKEARETPSDGSITYPPDLKTAIVGQGKRYNEVLCGFISAICLHHERVSPEVGP